MVTRHRVVGGRSCTGDDELCMRYVWRKASRSRKRSRVWRSSTASLPSHSTPPIMRFGQNMTSCTVTGQPPSSAHLRRVLATWGNTNLPHALATTRRAKSNGLGIAVTVESNKLLTFDLWKKRPGLSSITGIASSPGSGGISDRPAQAPVASSLPDDF